ncbi:MAG: penicillin-binding protein 2 [Gammaproteobacteria bacterium]|nr:penicillin-binding protein 2 [Gammaproteobacteria bacterium]
MANRIELKNHIREAHLFNRRALTAIASVLVLFVVIVIRLVDLQVINHEHFTTLSDANRITINPIAPTRGLIFDRNGEILAQNLSAFSLDLIPERVPDLDETLVRLSSLIAISDDDIARFRKHRREEQPFDRVTLRYHLTDSEVAKIAINLHTLPGVEVNAGLIRDYPLNKLMAHVTGYMGRLNVKELQHVDESNYRATRFIGKTGIEKHYEDTLHGTVGYEHVESNALGRTLRVIKHVPPVSGQNLYLSVDTQLQRIATIAMKDNRGAVIAIDPSNGDLLASVSLPSYDPNLFVTGIDQASYDEMRNSRDRPLFNRAINGQYPPGSTLKPFIGLDGLAANKVRINTTSFCPGWYSLPGDDHKYRDWKTAGHGTTTLNKAIVESCDVYFYDLAKALGIDEIHDFLTPFGFGARTGIDTSRESPGLLPSREWKRSARQRPWYPGETLITGIGQGYTLVTPLQLAMATATLSHKGQGVTPRLVYATQSSKDQILHVRPTQMRRPIRIQRNKDWNDILDAMREVVTGIHGTAHVIYQNEAFPIAGKTGTAQVFTVKQDEKYDAKELRKRLLDHALFIAFAPVDKPRIAVAVIVENGGHGSSVAAPIARKVIDAYLEGL